MADFGAERWWGNSDSSNTRRVLVFPGVHYGVEQAGLMLPCRALAAEGWTVWTVRWSLDDVAQDAEQRRAVVTAAADEVEALSAGAGTTLVLAKSIGSFTAAWAARHGFPGVWLTPLVRFDEVREAIASNPAPQLLVDGSLDPSWNEQQARATGKQVEVVGPVDHSFFPTSGWQEHLHALDRITQATLDFAAQL